MITSDKMLHSGSKIVTKMPPKHGMIFSVLFVCHFVCFVLFCFLSFLLKWKVNVVLEVKAEI